MTANNFYQGSTTSIHIYEINCQLEQILSYRIYRADNEDNTIMLTDEVDGSMFVDTTWKSVPVGMYRFGISEVFGNGNESEIIWSEPIEKTNHGLGENGDSPTLPSVQKVLENGHIVIIKDGKRYTVTGQQLN